MNLLQIGDYARGFAECEWRGLNGFHCPHPKWDGQPIPEKTLLIYTELGAEDALQFARYLPLAAKRCKNLILACPTELMPIFATIPGIGQIREPGQIGVAEFDTYLPLMSLPHVFKTTLDTIPATYSLHRCGGTAQAQGKTCAAIAYVGLSQNRHCLGSRF